MINDFVRPIAQPRTALAARHCKVRLNHAGLVFLSRILLLMVLVSPAQAQFDYSAQNGTVVILRFTGTGSEVVIPETIDGLPVTRIGTGAFYGRTNLTRVSIPAGVAALRNSQRDIAAEVFAGCSTLTAIDVDADN